MPINGETLPDDDDQPVTEVEAQIQEAFEPGSADGTPAGPEPGTPALGAPEPGAPDSEAGLAELSARYTRLAADFENHRRRSAREAVERSRYGAETAARALLPVLDNLRRAVDHAPADTPAGLLEGLHHTVRQFEDALASVGVVPIEAEGQPFDPSLHEAVMGEESADVEVDTVAADLQRGYRLHDRVLRPSMVKVAHPAAAARPG